MSVREIVIDKDAAVINVKRNGVEVAEGSQGLELTLEDNDTGFRWVLTFENEEVARRLAREVLAAYE